MLLVASSRRGRPSARVADDDWAAALDSDPDSDQETHESSANNARPRANSPNGFRVMVSAAAGGDAKAASRALEYLKQQGINSITLLHVLSLTDVEALGTGEQLGVVATLRNLVATQPATTSRGNDQATAIDLNDDAGGMVGEDLETPWPGQTITRAGRQLPKKPSRDVILSAMADRVGGQFTAMEQPPPELVDAVQSGMRCDTHTK